MTHTDAHRQQALRLAALAETIVSPAHEVVQGRGLALYRLTVTVNGLEAVQVWTTTPQRCVLCVDGCGQVLVYKGGGWEPTLAQWAAEVRGQAPPPAAPDRVQLTLDLAAELLAEAAAHEQAVLVTGAELSPLEVVGAATVRAWERQEVAAVAPAAVAWTGNRERPGRVWVRANGAA